MPDNIVNPIKDEGGIELTDMKNTIYIDHINATKVNENNGAVKKEDITGATYEEGSENVYQNEEANNLDSHSNTGQLDDTLHSNIV